MESKSTRKLIILAVAVAVLILTGWIVLNRLLDPNLYKPQIVAAVKRETGRDLKINGRLDWSFIPLGFELSDVELSNRPGFGKEPFAKIKTAEIQVQLRPLFNRKLVVNELDIDGLTLNLNRSPEGAKNWTGLAGNEPPPQQAARKSQKKRKENAQTTDHSSSESDLTLGKVTVNDANIYWKDDQSRQTYSVHNLKLETGKIGSDDPFDIDLNFELQQGKEKQRSKIRFESKYHPRPEGFMLSGLKLNIDESEMTGNAELIREPVPVWQFDFVLDEFDADRYFPKSQGRAKEKSGESPLVVVAGMNGKGNVRIGKLKIYGMSLSDVVIRTTIADGIFHLGPDQANLYGGKYHGQTMIDASGPSLGLQFNERFENVKAGPLFQDLQVLKKLSGTGNIQLKLNTHGVNSEDFSRSLIGSVDLTLTNGKIQGVDLEKVIRETRTLSARIKGKMVEADTRPTDQTLFQRMTATVQFTNGIGKTDNVRIEGNVIDAAGGGTIDLHRETVDMRLKVTFTEPGKEKGTNVPVFVRGKFQDPKFGVDWDQLIESAIDRNLDNQLNKALKKFFKKEKNR